MRSMIMRITGVLCALTLVGGVFALTTRSTSANQSAGAVVEQAVYDALAASNDGTTYVVIMLQAVPMPVGATAIEIDRVKVDVNAKQDAVLSTLSPGEFTPVYLYGSFAGMTGYVDAAGLAKLEAHPEVTAIGVDIKIQATLDTSVPFINADDVQTNLGVTGAGITVAVLDTGIDTDHPDLVDDVAPGAWHFLGNGANQGPGAEDDNGHGSHVSGCITSKGVVASVGVAPDTDILAVKILDAGGSGNLNDLTRAVDYVVQNKNNYDNLCALNMSVGSLLLFASCPCDAENVTNQAMGAALTAATNAGIACFASSGNDAGCGIMSAPACLLNAMPVAAVYDTDNFLLIAYGAPCTDVNTVPDQITCFSNRGACNELAAPGAGVFGPVNGGGTDEYFGTSQASPHCAGVAALLCECAENLGISLTPAQILQIMKDTGVQLQDQVCLTAPALKRVDAYAAVTSLKPISVFVTSFLAKPIELGVAMSWEVFADEAVSGFRIYRTANGGLERPITDDLPAADRRYVDRSVDAGVTYEYVLAAVTLDGSEHRSLAVTARPLGAAMRLSQNNPNPFNPETTIEYTLGEAADVTIAVYDAAGRHVVTLEDGSRSAGPHSIKWDGRDGRGGRVPAGIYFYRLTAGTQTMTRKAVLLR